MNLYTEDYSFTSETKEVMNIIQTPIINLVNWVFDGIEAKHCTQVQGINGIYSIIRKAIMREKLPEGYVISTQIKEVYTVFYELLCKGYSEDFLYCVTLTEVSTDIAEATIRRGLAIRKTRRREILRKAGK